VTATLDNKVSNIKHIYKNGVDGDTNSLFSPNTGLTIYMNNVGNNVNTISNIAPNNNSNIIQNVDDDDVSKRNPDDHTIRLDIHDNDDIRIIGINCSGDDDSVPKEESVNSIGLYSFATTTDCVNVEHAICDDDLFTDADNNT